jgi:hypothetical protein
MFAYFWSVRAFSQSLLKICDIRNDKFLYFNTAYFNKNPEEESTVQLMQLNRPV